MVQNLPNKSSLKVDEELSNCPLSFVIPQLTKEMIIVEFIDPFDYSWCILTFTDDSWNPPHVGLPDWNTGYKCVQYEWNSLCEVRIQVS